MANSRDNQAMTEGEETKGRIVILYYPEAVDDMDVEATDPEWRESTWSVEGAEEALGRLQNFISKHKK